jgi:wobble nucleotide-excising tRNase
VKAVIKTTTDLSIPKAAEVYEDLSPEFDSAAATVRNECDSAKLGLEVLVKVLEDKKNNAFERVDLRDTISDLNSGVINNLNEVIRKHNQACGDFQSRIDSARENLEADSVAANLDEFVSRRDELNSGSDGIQKATDDVQQLTGKIRDLEREIVEHLQPAEELNEDLRKYLGHDELRLDTKDTGYEITRNGVPAKALSEGETTAISLLYFLKSLQDRQFDLTKGVVVLDDPVSSLDTNALYLAFGFIRERTQDAAQLFIFTHNFTFFRQVRNWFHHLKGQSKRDVRKRPARFYMLDCASDGKQRCSSIRPLDPLLEQYDSEYHYLFARIYKVANASTPRPLGENYVLPNMARRLVEAFLAFRQPKVSGELWQKFKEVEFDEAKKLRILRFLHTHSHSGAIAEPEHDPSLLGEASPVLTDLLEFIRNQDPEHFSAMVQLSDPPVDEGGEQSQKE